MNWVLHVIEKYDELLAVEELQSQVWPGDERDIVPAHLLIAAVNHGGMVIGAYFYDKAQRNDDETDRQIQSDRIPPGAKLVGFVFGFPGIYETPDGPRLMHYSHQLGIHPDYRDQGIGFSLKRAQWQLVRRQGVDRISWTFDPLLSRNANLNILRLGAVCNTYHREVYGEMRDQLNIGLPSDRFLVDWWVNSKRVSRRLSKRRRIKLDLAHYLAGGIEILNPSHLGERGFPLPDENHVLPLSFGEKEPPAMTLVEIPADFQNLRSEDPGLGLAWRMHTRLIFEQLFARGYLVTDFIFLPYRIEPKEAWARSFYVLSFGERMI
jgi:predicted GNAT superfamily acetyltransferase